MTRGEDHRFGGVLDWSDVNRFLSARSLPPGAVVVTRRGRRLPAEAYTRTAPRYPDQPSMAHLSESRLCARSLRAALRAGASLTLNGLDDHHGPVAELVREMESRLRVRVYANAYMSWGTTNGLPHHWDDHDVMVLQVAGRKHWSLRPPSQPHPMEGSGAPNLPAADEPAIELELTSGDVLHVPRGWWHLVTPVDEPSLHVTFGFTRRTGVHFLGWLADHLRGEAEFRRDLPHETAPESQAEHLARLRKILLGHLSDPGVLDRYRDATRDAFDSPRIDLPVDGLGADVPDERPPGGRGR
ncbi:JmjC domain-containing protein [Streptomyces sp. ODS05-4]|uniref:JmjC domain-containing protein n=1 Tax=Streptomyces sp. ODS05-4 TaxID=2944939 RepID=UPI0027E43CDC|nr:cupin domain-containing protein [Streptomyces sp. ODS05-4]